MTKKLIRASLPTPAEEAKIIEAEKSKPAHWSVIETDDYVNDIDDSLIPEQHCIRDYIHATAQANRCNKAAVITCLLTGVSGLIGNRAGFQPYQNNKKIFYPILWGAIVGGPSLRKTSILNAGIAPVKIIDKRVYSKETNNTYDKQSDATKLEMEIANIKKGKKGADDTDTTPLADLYKQLDFVQRKFGRITIIQDTTTEALQELFRSNQDGVFQVCDELSRTLSAWDNQGRGGDREYYLEAWEGGNDGSYKQLRIGRGAAVAEWRGLSLLGTTQPDKWNKLINDAKDGGNDGLILCG